MNELVGMPVFVFVNETSTGYTPCSRMPIVGVTPDPVSPIVTASLPPRRGRLATGRVNVYSPPPASPFAITLSNDVRVVIDWWIWIASAALGRATSAASSMPSTMVNSFPSFTQVSWYARCTPTGAPFSRGSGGVWACAEAGASVTARSAVATRTRTSDLTGRVPARRGRPGAA